MEVAVNRRMVRVMMAVFVGRMALVMHAQMVKVLLVMTFTFRHYFFPFRFLAFRLCRGSLPGLSKP